uniref:Uncharacterized protein n=1 Tax=Arundo donax TaxID=35708 RepID=A0A0A9GVB6_ARUDO
MTPSCIQIAFI